MLRLSEMPVPGIYKRKEGTAWKATPVFIFFPILTSLFYLLQPEFGKLQDGWIIVFMSIFANDEKKLMFLHSDLIATAASGKNMLFCIKEICK